ncbi:FliO/MopB family protein [Mobiluncus porci]|uniref:FliO/MopB family protein n=1 Tax=Mobiluncus porci TaxID=2652278 RepID=A0A7K0K3F6_9ACTO|nr:flagellar biosynthetic protein FliO [Mobiluncus porci]MST50012.1 FliO/MopB family protein [Mobiluncus porci]
MNLAMFLAELTAKPLPAAENPLTIMLRFLVGIAVVFLLLWLLYRWVKRTNLGDYQGPGLRLISRLALTRSAMVAVVEIGGRMFLVGAGDSAVTPIAELYDTEEMASELDSQAAALAAAQAQAASRKPVKKPFSQVLAKVSRKAAAPVGEDSGSTKAVTVSSALPSENAAGTGSGAAPRPQSATQLPPRQLPAGKTGGQSATAASGVAGAARQDATGKSGKSAAGSSAGVAGGSRPAGSPRLAPSGQSSQSAQSAASSSAGSSRGSGFQPGSARGGVAPETARPQPQVTDAQMDALAAQIAAEFGVKPAKSGETS